MKLNDTSIESTEVVSMVNTFEKIKGPRLYWELLKWIFTGMFMGTSDAIPGYSGGTTLALLGFFKRLILISKSVFAPEPGLTRLKALVFMVPFGLGWITGVFGFAKLTEFMVERGCGLELIFFFAIFIGSAIPIFLKSENPKLRVKDHHQKRRWIFFGVGLLLVIVVSLSTFFFTNGAPWTSDGQKDTVEAHHFDYTHDWWKLILVSYFAGIITITPGGSGAIVQLLSGMYKNIHWKIMAHPIDNIGGLVTFAISTFVGMLTAVFVFSWILKHFSSDLAALSFGMLLASILAIFLVPQKEVWNELDNWKHILGVTASSIIAICVGIAINYIVRYKHSRMKAANIKS